MSFILLLWLYYVRPTDYVMIIVSLNTFEQSSILTYYAVGYITQWRTVYRKSMDYTSLCDEADDVLRVYTSYLLHLFLIQTQHDIEALRELVVSALNTFCQNNFGRCCPDSAFTKIKWVPVYYEEQFIMPDLLKIIIPFLYIYTNLCDSSWSGKLKYMSLVPKRWRRTIERNHF